jgi:phosphonate transport system substrate-binding protein
MLRFATFLAPSIFPVYQFVAEYVGQRLGCPTELAVGESFDEFAEGKADVGFICGLPYVQLSRIDPSPVELLAVPVLQGERYGGRPVYFSDVIVRRGSPLRSFEDLRGCRWAYNDLDSHSGYNITRYRLLRMGETRGYFGEVVAAGWHQRSIEMVRSGEVDASAIDSQVLAVALRDRPELAEELEVIDTLGPSTIQPVVAAGRLPEELKAGVREALISMDKDPLARERLGYGLVERFTPIADAAYAGIREMLTAAEEAGFLQI